MRFPPLALPLLLVATACGSSNTHGPCVDSCGDGFLGSQADMALATSSAHSFHFVLNKVLMPSTSDPARAYKYDVDGTGRPRNQLAAIMDTVTTLGGPDPQPEVDSALAAGTMIELLQVGTGDSAFANDPGAVVSGWLGRNGDPATLFTGSGTVSVDVAAEPPQHLLAGTIASSRLETGPQPPGALPLALPLAPGMAPVRLTIYGAHISAKVSARTEGGFNLGSSRDPASGVINGGLSVMEVHDRVLPAFTSMLQSYVMSGAPDAATILAYFDTNKDGMLDAGEVESNAVVQALLTPDLDLFDQSGALAPNTDKVKDSLSLGVGFTAVPVKFPTQ